MRSREVGAAVEFTLRETGLPAWVLGGFPDLLAAGERIDAGQQEGFRSLGAAAAAEGFGLRELVDTYLSLSRRALPHLPGVLAALDRADPAGVRAVAAEAIRHTEEAVAALADGYSAALAGAAQRAASLRREFVDDLIGGTADAASLVKRAGLLGLRLAGRLVVLAVRTDRPLADYGPVMQRVEYVLTGRLGATGVVVAARRGLLACVLPADDDALAGLVLEVVRGVETERPWCVAVSRPRSGPGAVAGGWREAQDALALADLIGPPRDLVRAADLAGYQLLLGDRTALADLVADVLGPLEGARGGADPLVDTLVALFGAGGNVSAAARALHLSVRATLYRLDRIRRLTGYGTDDPGHRFTLEVAAIGAKLLGGVAGSAQSTGRSVS